MHLKSFIIGIFLFCIGGGMFWWIVSERKVQERQSQEYKQKYGSETSEYIKLYEEWMLQPAEERTDLPSGLDLKADKSPEQILQEQQERLIADMDKLAAGETTTYPFAEDFYGLNWRDKVEEYKKQKENREFLYNVSIACAASGGLLAGLIILFSFARVIIKTISKLKNAIFNRSKKQAENQDIDNDEQADKDQNGESIANEDSKDNEHYKDISNVLVNSGWQYAGSFGAEQKPRLRQRKRIPAKNRIVDENEKSDAVEENIVDTNDNVENTQQKPVEKETSENVAESETVKNQDLDVINTTGHTHLIDNTLKDLTQQVSAIREYAANQQNRLERLQDGYDWNIIKTFCLRIIRCIDNVEKRIEMLKGEKIQVTHLEEVKDELVFALESSGIEQFEPKVNTYYRGQEKIAEAIKEKTHSDDPNKKGKIEKVLKSGYKFYIDDDNVKIVRPAQVKLYA